MLTTWQSFKSLLSSAAANTVSPKTPPHSLKLLFEVWIVEALPQRAFASWKNSLAPLG